MNLDFPPASSQSTESIPIENVTVSFWKYIWAHYMPLVIVYLLAIAVSLYFDHSFLSSAILIVMGGFGYSFVYGKIKTEFTEEFGKSIGFTYTKTADLSTVSGWLFETGDTRSLIDVLSGIYKNIPMRIFTFRFMIQEGKYSHTYSYTTFEATLAGKVPDILLYSNSDVSQVSDRFGGDETVELEGDFNKYFKLRVPKGYEQEAYQIFTPDVMVDLIDKARDVNFEFSDNKLYIYATQMITKREEFQSMFDLSEYLVGLFEKNTAHINTKV